MDIILRPFAWLLLLLYNFVNNYGVALFLFAILVKVILFPLSLKGKKSMIQMNMLSGKMQKLQKQYGKDKERYNLEVQKLYEKEKVNPMGGCLWSMIPLFILIPLYSVIRQPLKYMMGLSAEQISSIAEKLNWAQRSIEMGWVKNVTDAAQNVYTAGAYNELYLASMINSENLAAAQAAAGEGANVIAMNFGFLGMDLSQVPTWKFWSNGMDWTTIGLFLLVLISATTGILFSVIMQRTNNVNRQNDNAQAAQTNRMMMMMTPLMSLWIGFMMPGLLCVYWIANNLLSMVQEIICGKLLKKDYEEAARMQAENEAREKEEEKQRKREAAERRARELEEAKKNKKKGQVKKNDSKQDRSVAEVSRVGLRTYARGRAYDPDRFGGVTVYRDPSAPVDEAAIEAALAAKGKTEQTPVEDEPAVEAAAVENTEILDETAAADVEETVPEADDTEIEEAGEAAESEPNEDKQ